METIDMRGFELSDFLTKHQFELASIHPDLTTDLIHQYRDQLNWRLVCRYHLLPESFMIAHCQYLHWDEVSIHQHLSTIFMQAFGHYLSWELLSRYQAFTDQGLLIFKPRLDLDALIENPLVEFKRIERVFREVSQYQAILPDSQSLAVQASQNAAYIHQFASMQCVPPERIQPTDLKQREFYRQLDDFMLTFTHFTRSLSTTISVADMKKLYTLPEVLMGIRNFIDKHPESIRRVDHFTNYYLPALTDLMGVYQDISLLETPQTQQAKDEIIGAFSPVLTAFNRLLDSLYDQTLLDVSVDVTLLRNLFKQDGLIKDFNSNKKGMPF